MKRSIFILCFLFTASTFVAHAENKVTDKETLSKEIINQLWDQANTAYVNGDYGRSIILYDSIVNQNLAGSKLYYNLGNAYFKSNNIGRAILYYNKALKLSPSDKDIEYNIAVANSYIKDKIEVLPEFFASKWIRSLRTSLNSNAWGMLSLIFLAGALGCALLFFLGKNKFQRKSGFFTAILLILIFIITTSFSLIERQAVKNVKEAIVLSSAVSAKSSPERTGKELFIIHEGTKVDITNRYNEWVEILLADGNKGWIPDYSIGLID